MDELSMRVLKVVDKMAYSKSEFVSHLDISLAVISHIASGRNKPGVELLQKILLKYPSVSADWLLLGQGTMEKQEGRSTEKQKQSVQLIESRLQNAIFDLKTINEMLQELKSQL